MAEIAKAIPNQFLRFCETIYCKSQNFYLIEEPIILFGNKAEVRLHPNIFFIFGNWVEGQKTGFFLDQRENRKLLGEFLKR